MKLTFCGAARTVTGSKHLVELQNGKRILLDCGLYQGHRSDADRLNREFLFDPKTIDIVLLSHAHIDHSGLLPKLYKDGFRGLIYTTHASYSLCALMLLDSAHIQEKDTKYHNKKRRKKGQPELVPLYEMEDAERVLEQFVSVSYGQPFSPCEGVNVEYRDAGHILGSATMVLEIEENGKTTKLGFTGDVGSPDRPILRDPQKMDDCDYLIMESTYGGRTHEGRERAKEGLLEVVKATSERGGKVIIPSFAVGRTQEIVHALDQLWNEGRLPEIPAFVDSPLAVNATGVYLSHPECYDRNLRQYLIEDENPFGFERLQYVRDVEKSKALNEMHEPMIIISASGMAQAGRILHHLRNNVENEKNTVMIVGYCAEGTLGKRLVDKAPEIRIFGQEHRVKSEVVVMNSYSAHADEPGLISFAKMLDVERLKSIFLVHGVIERQEILKAKMQSEGFGKISIPEYGESVVLD